MKMIQHEIQRMGRVVKEYLPVFTVCFSFSVVLYFSLMSNQLVNSEDGLWEYSYYKAGRWSLSLGRWFWLYLDRLRFGISTEPVTSLITLACFSGGFIFILDLFELGKKKTGYLAGMLFLSSTAVCISLSYRFMSPTFGFAFLLNVLAAWVVIRWKNRILSVLISGVLIALGMGLYQAYIGCTCMILAGYFIYVLQKEEMSLKDIGTDIAKVFLAAVAGGVLYVGILNLHLAVFHMDMADYNGANMYSLGNTVKNLPAGIVNAYRVFSRYFMEGYYKTNVLQGGGIYPVSFLAALIILALGFAKAWKRSKWKAAVYILMVLAIPVACNAVLFIATAAWTSLQMTGSMALCFPVLLCVAAKILGPQKKWLVWINTLLPAVMVYGNIYQVQLDQNAMLEGRTATTTMAGDIISDLRERGQLSPELKYCVIGNPSYNELFGTSVLFEKANSYARFGSWNLDNTCNRRSWQGVFSYLCGVDLQMCSSSEYGAILADEAVQEMEVYPNEGYISRMEDIVVIKVAD